MCNCWIMCFARLKQHDPRADDIAPRVVQSIEECSPSIKTAKYVQFSRPTKVHFHKSSAPSPATITPNSESDQGEYVTWRSKQ